MIWFGRIELATYPNRPLDSMNFNAKEALNSSSVHPTESNHENLKKKIKNSFGRIFSTFWIRFASLQIVSICIEFESFTVAS